MMLRFTRKNIKKNFTNKTHKTILFGIYYQTKFQIPAIDPDNVAPTSKSSRGHQCNKDYSIKLW
jgi:hypothetical protein